MLELKERKVRFIYYTFILGAGRKIKDEDMEFQLNKWYYDQHVGKNISLTAKDIKKMALSLTSCEDFIASKGWLQKMKKKYKWEIQREISRKKIS